MLTRQGVLTVFQTLSAAGCKGGPSDAAAQKACAEVWRQCMPDMDDAELLDLAFAHLRDPEEGRWWPVPGLLLQHGGMTGGDRSLLDMSADLAWGQVLDGVRHRGWVWGPPPRWTPSNALEAAYRAGIAAAGGWSGLCQAESSDMPARAASFRRAFDTVCKRGAAGSDLLPEVPRVAGTWKGLGDALGGLLDAHAPRLIEDGGGQDKDRKL